MGHAWGTLPALAATAVLLPSPPSHAPSASAQTPPPLRVSDDGRRLESGGRPFFYLADTVGPLDGDTSRQAISRHVKARASGGFTVLHAALAAREGSDDGTCRWSELAVVEHLVVEAAAHGLYVALHPALDLTPGSPPDAKPCAVRDEAAAQAAGRALGARYRPFTHVTWVVGSARPSASRLSIWAAFARGLAEGGRGAPRKLLAYEAPPGEPLPPYSSDARWVDVAIARLDPAGERPEALVAAMTARRPSKPVIAAGPMPSRGPDSVPSSREGVASIRQSAYAAMFAGAAGYASVAPPIEATGLGARRLWPGGASPPRSADPPHLAGEDDPDLRSQLSHLRRLLARRDRDRHEPAPDLLIHHPAGPTTTARALSGPRRDWALVHVPAGAPAPSIDVERIRGRNLRVFWFDPRSGNDMEPLPVTDRTRPLRAIPPDSEDWVLVLETDGEVPLPLAREVSSTARRPPDLVA